MQWIIDIMTEWAAVQGFLTAAFVDRGDPAGWDFATGDFTRDAAWHDLDLSAIVPAPATSVLLHNYVAANAINQQVRFREKGNANEINVVDIRTLVANIATSPDIICPISTDRKLQYWVSGVAITACFLTVKGWWL